MKNQVSFFSKTKSKKLECRLLQFLFGASMVKQPNPDKEFHCLATARFSQLLNKVAT